MKSPNRIAAFFLIAASFTLVATSARADQVTFSTLGPGGTYLDNDVVPIYNVTGVSNQDIANSFVPTISGDLSSISVAVALAGPPYDANFVLRLEANNPAGGPLFSAPLVTSPILTATLPLDASDTALTTFTYTGPEISLTAGTTYWLDLAPADTNSVLYWDISNLPVTTQVYSSTDNDVSYQHFVAEPPFQGAFQVNVTQPALPAVPEPTTMLFGAALLGVCATARRRLARG
jgi:hypothetical protein